MIRHIWIKNEETCLVIGAVSILCASCGYVLTSGGYMWEYYIREEKMILQRYPGTNSLGNIMKPWLHLLV